jgi:hypothetical protein
MHSGSCPTATLAVKGRIKLPTTMLNALLSADGQVIVATTGSGWLMATQRMNDVVTIMTHSYEMINSVVMVDGKTVVKLSLCTRMNAVVELMVGATHS